MFAVSLRPLILATILKDAANPAALNRSTNSRVGRVRDQTRREPTHFDFDEIIRRPTGILISTGSRFGDFQKPLSGRLGLHFLATKAILKDLRF
jgi:hypothetical protein